MLNLLHFYISTFRSMCAVHNMAVFCSALILCFPGTLLRYFLDHVEVVPLTSIIAGITFVFTLHMRCISVVRSLYFITFSVSFFITFLSPKIEISIYIHVHFHYHGLWCLLYCQAWFCQFALVNSTIWLSCLLDLFLLILVLAHTSVSI